MKMKHEEKSRVKGKRTIRQNVYGNWNGYVGGRKVEMFFGSGGSGSEQEFQAREWLAKGGDV